MLGKLIAHEFKTLAKPTLIILGIMLIAGIAGILSFSLLWGFMDMSATSYRSSLVTSGTMTALTLLSLFLGFLVWASVVALFIYLIVRFYRTMFTDEGYLTLTLPVSTAALVGAKYLVACILMVAAVVIATILYGTMLLPIEDLGSWDYIVNSLFALMGGTYGLMTSVHAGSIFFGMLSMVFTIAYQLALAFFTLALGAWWARRHKLAVAVALFLGITWALSLVFSVISVLILSAASAGTTAALVSSVIQLLVNGAVAAGAFLGTVFVIKHKVDLN